MLRPPCRRQKRGRSPRRRDAAMGWNAGAAPAWGLQPSRGNWRNRERTGSARRQMPATKGTAPNKLRSTAPPLRATQGPKQIVGSPVGEYGPAATRLVVSDQIPVDIKDSFDCSSTTMGLSIIDAEKTCGKLAPDVLIANYQRVLLCYTAGQILIHYFRGLLMLSGTPRLACGGRGLLSICFAFFISISAATAQQASGQSGQATASPGLPAAQPAAAAAVSASGAASTQAKIDTTKDASDESLTVKLGPGDLI